MLFRLLPFCLNEYYAASIGLNLLDEMSRFNAAISAAEADHWKWFEFESEEYAFEFPALPSEEALI